MARSIKLKLSAAGCVGLALLLLVLPLGWIAAWITAAAFHECCHALAVKLCGGKVVQVDIGGPGAAMEVTGLTGAGELICALAGPLGALCLLLLARWIPKVAVCAVFQSAYNLLPLYPMDGGRALLSGLRIIAPSRAGKICQWVGRITLILIWGGAAYAAIGFRLGIMPLAMALILNLKIRGNSEKSLAIRGVSEYNI